MLGDDTDFVRRLEADGVPLIHAPEMRVLHPPNVI
jgi:GT2 family glycosyltransferase